jgi:hypothetical protein
MSILQLSFRLQRADGSLRPRDPLFDIETFLTDESLDRLEAALYAALSEYLPADTPFQVELHAHNGGPLIDVAEDSIDPPPPVFFALGSGETLVVYME